MLAIEPLDGALVKDLISIAALFGFFAIAINFIAYKRGFFALPELSQDLRVLHFLPCFTCVCIYFINGYVLAPTLYHLATTLFTSLGSSLFQEIRAKMLLLQTIDILLNITFLGLYIFFNKQHVFINLWKDPQVKRLHSYTYDLLIGCFTWFIAFPTVVAINALSDWLHHVIFREETIDQVAVKFLKLSSSSTITLVFSLAIIILCAPFMEEFIFRGCIQNYLRRILGIKTSIICTSLLFAGMHYSSMQKSSNLPLLISLFTFSIYLGFLYEKTRSLLSPILLHLTFNAFSVLRILLQ